MGESAAAGTPDPAFGFARILEVMLRRQFPDRRIEVINAAMRGINSHIILPIARECVRLQPDLFIVTWATMKPSASMARSRAACISHLA